MPSHQVHCFYDRVLFGKSYIKVHRAIDAPYVVFKRGHRKYLHDGFSALVLAEHCYPGDKRAVGAALFHKVLDDYCTANPFYAQYLEFCVKQEALKRRQNRKKKAVKAPRAYGARKLRSDPAEEVRKTMKKMLEVQELYGRMMSQNWRINP